MTDKIKSAIDRIIDTRDYKYSHFSFIDDTGKAFDLAIRSLKAWSEVLEELEGQADFSNRCGDTEEELGIKGAIDIIKQKLAEIEE